ncbi:MAG: hypothetical protein Q9178_002017 [Gyalolechia marmorata]
MSAQQHIEEIPCFTHYIHDCPRSFTSFSSALSHIESSRCCSGITFQDLHILLIKFTQSDAHIHPESSLHFHVSLLLEMSVNDARDYMLYAKVWHCTYCNKRFGYISGLFHHVESERCAASLQYGVFENLATFLQIEIACWQGMQIGPWTSVEESSEEEAVDSENGWPIMDANGHPYQQIQEQIQEQSQPFAEEKDLDITITAIDVPTADNSATDNGSVDPTTDPKDENVSGYVSGYISTDNEEGGVSLAGYEHYLQD